MKILKVKKLYLPALSIVAVVLLLLILMSISTYRNLNREREMALQALHRQGTTLIRSLEAGARTGMMIHRWAEDSVGRLIQETTRDSYVAYVFIVDNQGQIVHHSGISQKINSDPWKVSPTGDPPMTNRITTLPDGSQVYEITKKFSPQPLSTETPHHRMTGLSHTHRDDLIIVGLKMTEFEEARRSDIQHALIMASVLVVLGTGGLFFIFVIQNYYLIDRTLEQTQDFTRQIVTNMANGLLSIDRDGKVTTYNPSAIQLLELDKKRIKEINFKTIIDFEETGINETLETCRSVMDVEITHRRRNGERIPLSISATPILGDDDGCSGAVIVLHDLREIKQLENKVKRAEKMAAIGELAAGVAHEIRNPLSSIRGFAQYLQHFLKNNLQEQEYTRTMISEVDRVNSVITNLLTFARPMAVVRSMTNVQELIKKAINLTKTDAESKNVDVILSVQVPGNNFLLDENQMLQVLLNLLLNAIQAAASNGQIEIGYRIDAENDKLEIWIEDDGIGVPAEKTSKIFEPFFTTREKGTGLGLSIVHKIVENHGGEIMLQSPPLSKSHGCRFTIIIPGELI
ncbi:MAG: ATP-binding protein [Desulfobacterales bacterium]|jgi:two-component system sensor histidine kinase HydH